MIIDLPYNFNLRPYQSAQFTAQRNGINRFYKVWHRRAGKDLTDINFTIMQMMQRVGNYWHLLPEYKQARKAVWRGKTAEGKSYLDYFPPELIKKKRDQEMEIELINGSIWQLMGSDNIHSARGSGPVGIVFSEFAFTHPDAWPTIEPILLENGGWAVFNTTPYGPNHAKDLWDKAQNNPKWMTQLLTIGDTCRDDGSPIVTEEMLAELRTMGTSEETIQREYYCSWEGSIEGAYYADSFRWLEENKKLTSVPHESGILVKTYWDIGRSDYTSVWFMQKVGREYRFIDYFQMRGGEIPDFVRELLVRTDYIYDEHILPHDAGHLRIGMSGKTIKQQMADALPKHTFRIQPQTQGVQSDIMLTRTFLRKCVFDTGRCKQGIDALRSYTKKFNDAMNRFEDKPLHNWASDGADAFRYSAVDNRDDHDITPASTNRHGIPTFNAAVKRLGQRRGRI